MRPVVEQQRIFALVRAEFQPGLGGKFANGEGRAALESPDDIARAQQGERQDCPGMEGVLRQAAVEQGEAASAIVEGDEFLAGVAASAPTGRR